MPRLRSASGPSTTAPAPSPKITATSRPRVVRSIPVECTSAPTSRTCSQRPVLTNLSAIDEAVEEAGALVANVEGRHAPDAEALLQQSRRWRGMSTSGLKVAKITQSTSPRRHPGSLQRLAGRQGAHVGGTDAIFAVVTLANPRALLDPLVGGLHHASPGRRW